MGRACAVTLLLAIRKEIYLILSPVKAFENVCMFPFRVVGHKVNVLSSRKFSIYMLKIYLALMKKKISP